MTRTQKIAVVSAATIALVLGLALIALFFFLNADHSLTLLTAAVLRGEISLAQVANAISHGAPVVQHYLSK